MTPNRITPVRRRGLTLVELMVAMALSLGIMVILTEAFKLSLDFASHSGSTGRMIAQLDAAETVLRRDLQADHFLSTADAPGQTGKLVDQRLDKLTKFATGWVPPRGGFFRIISPQPVVDAVDRDSIAITSATNHALHFTVILPGGTEDKLFTATVPAGSGTLYKSRAAEVAYFLVPMAGNPRTAPGPSGLPLYNLIRRQRLVALTDDDRSALQPALTDPRHQEVISETSGVINTLADVQKPTHRMTITPGQPGGEIHPTSPRYGEDILTSNVLSFEVLVDWGQNVNPPASVFPRGKQPPHGLLTNSNFPYGHLWQGGGPEGAPFLFDTYASSLDRISQAIRVKSLRISLRVFDPSTRMARQATWTFVP